MYKCTHFDIEELVPRHVFIDRGNNAWELFDDRLLITLDTLRDKYGRIVVNDWKWGGKNEWRGYRDDKSPVGTKYSQHRFGRAVDCILLEQKVEDVRKEIMGNKDLFPHINAVELKVSWLHIDVRNCNRILTFNE